MNRCNKNVIIEKTVELGKLLANSDILHNLREAEAAFLNDIEAQSIVNDIKELEKSSSINKIDNLKRKLFELDSYKKLLEAQETSKKLIEEIHGILNYYINGTSPKSHDNSCATCSRHCMNNK